MSIPDDLKDDQYFKIIVDPLTICKTYRPRFGQGKGFTLREFQAEYGADPFYSWFGLDSPMMYTAHKAAGGITSVYRQIGIGCQRLIRQVIVDRLGLNVHQSDWSYEIIKSSGKKEKRFLDARITAADVQDPQTELTIIQWLEAARQRLDLDDTPEGAIFEIRQGYKSKDSKRQNADLEYAANAYAQRHLPVILLLSKQIDADVAIRYQNARMLILLGATTGTTTSSTYVFCKEVLGYDLAAFFERNSPRLKSDVESVLEAILK